MPPDPHVLASLKDKLFELRQQIVSYEEHLERARSELAVITCAITIFHRDGGRITDVRPSNVRNLIKRGEAWTICRSALLAEPDGLSTRQLAIACLAAREFDHENPVLLRAMVALLANVLRKKMRRRELGKVELASRKVAWRLPSQGE